MRFPRYLNDSAVWLVYCPPLCIFPSPQSSFIDIATFIYRCFLYLPWFQFLWKLFPGLHNVVTLAYTFVNNSRLLPAYPHTCRAIVPVLQLWKDYLENCSLASPLLLVTGNPNGSFITYLRTSNLQMGQQELEMSFSWPSAKSKLK